MMKSTVMRGISIAMGTICLVGAGLTRGSERSPRDDLAALQQRLNTAREGHVRLSLSLWARTFLQPVKQPPIDVTIAWHDPDFYYVHVASWGDNPDSWYWLDGGELQQFESWRGKVGSRTRAHGVRVTNFAHIAGDRPRTAYCYTRYLAGKLDFVGNTGRKFLDVFGEADLKAMTIENRDAVWMMKEKATDFHSSLVNDYIADDKNAAFVVIEAVRRKQPLKVVSIYPDLKKSPDECDTARFDEIEFTFDRKKLTFPGPVEAIMAVEVPSLRKIDGDLLWRVPFTYPEVEKEPQRTSNDEKGPK